MRQSIKIISVVGARPNFMKIAPFIHAIDKHNKVVESSDSKAVGSSQKQDNSANWNGEYTSHPIEHILVHTGQHYDQCMSKAFFGALNIPRPDLDLEIGSGSHAEQVGKTMIAFEKVLHEQQPDWVIVVGDVNATCACSITAKKEHIKVAHIEAGLRSFDLNMPEEINRMVTDRLSDLLFTTDKIASENLRKEGVPEEKIKEVGNIMIDTLEEHREAAASLNINDIIAENCSTEHDASSSSPGKKPGQQKTPQKCYPSQFATSAGLNDSTPDYALMTMHRPSNVDSRDTLEPLIRFMLDEVCRDIPLIWPLHPRSEKQLRKFGLWEKVRACPNMILLQPVGYHEMLRLNLGASLMLTDSGGLQEECCVLGTPCMTLRWNTERPMTLREYDGASILVGNEIKRLQEAYSELRNHPRTPQRPALWDGHTAERIVKVLAKSDERGDGAV